MSPDNSAEVTLREITEETLGTILQLEVAEVSSQKVGANLGVRPWGRHSGLPLPRIIEKILAEDQKTLSRGEA